MNSGKEILVTGGAGYIGSHTVVALIEQGFNPVIIDDLSNSNIDSIKGINKITGKEVQFYQMNICDENALRTVFSKHKFEGIIHFAAHKAVGESVEHPLKYYKNNLIGLLNCLQVANEYNVEKFIFSSSCTVYGLIEGDNVVTEGTKIGEPLSPYGATKAMGEMIIKDTVSSSSIRVVNLRYFNPVGAHPSGDIGELPIGRPNNLLPFVTQTAVGKYDVLTVNGNDYNTPDGTCIRDYVHVMDVAEAHVKALNWLEEHKSVKLEVINIGTGTGTSVLEIIHIFEAQSNTKLNWKVGPRRAGDIPVIYADVLKAKNLLDWKAKRSVEDAVRDAWNWEQHLNNG